MEKDSVMTDFPTSLDNFSNPSGSDFMNIVDHAGQHSNLNDAVEALEAKVGINSSADTSSLDYKVAQNTAKISFDGTSSAKLAGIEAGATNNTGALADLDTVGTAQIDDDSVTDAKRPRLKACVLRGTSNQTIPTASWTDVTWDSEETDPENWHSNSTNPERITVSEDGLYLITAHASFYSSAATSALVRVLINNSTTNINSMSFYGDGSSFTDTAALTYPAILSAGDYIVMAVYQNSGGNVNLGKDASYAYNSSLRVVKLSD